MPGQSQGTRSPGVGRSGRAWRFRATVALGCVLLLGLVWLWGRRVPPDPVYQGKPLTRWLRAYTSPGRQSQEGRQADAAVRQLGTNCLPMLLRRLRERDSALTLRLVALAQKQKLFKIHFVPAAERNREASLAFVVLGEVAKPAVPELVRLSQENLSATSRAAIADALAWIGQAAHPALPQLLEATSNTNSQVRANALWALGEIHAEPGRCVPVLVQALKDPDDWVCLSAAHALGKFGPAAGSAVPALLALTNFSAALGPSFRAGKMQVVFEARNALRQIAPGVLTPSGSETFPARAPTNAAPWMSPNPVTQTNGANWEFIWQAPSGQAGATPSTSRR